MKLIDISKAQSATMLLCGLIVIIAVGLVVLKHIGKKSPLRKLHGKYVLFWMATGYATVGTCSVAGILKDDTGGAGTAAFGMLAGWVIGMIHGGLVVWWRIRHQRGE